MKRATRYAIVMVTTPDVKAARLLAKRLLNARLAACVNLVPKLESHYWWQGSVQTSNEVLMLIKTTTDKLPVLESLVLSEHPYETPEFVVLPLTAGTARYLSWISASVGQSG